MVLHTLTKQHCYKSSVAIRSRDIWSKHCPLQRVISSKRGNRYRLTCGITQLPSSFRQPHSVHSPPGSPHPAHITLSQSSHSFFLSLPRPFTPDLKLISFTNPFLHSHSYSFRTAFTDLNLYWIKGALPLVLVFFSGYVCEINKAEYSAFESTLNSAIVSYRPESWLSIWPFVTHVVICPYYVSGKNGPLHIKITLWIENDSHLQCLCAISQLACPLLRYCFFSRLY